MDDYELPAQKGMTQLFHATMEEEIADASTSIRRWWWEYLRLSKDYWFLCQTTRGDEPETTDKKLAQVYRDFGNIYEGTFEDWWRKRGSTLFAEQGAFPHVEQITSTQASTEGNRAGKILVEIPLQLTRETVIAQLSRILDHYSEERPRNKLAITTSQYPIEPVSIRMNVIQQAHEVHCLHRELIEKPKALARLGIQADSGALQADANLFRIGKVYGLSPANADLRGEPDQITAKTVAMRRDVRRVLDRALTLISHVEDGRFPPINEKPVTRKKARFSDEQMKLFEKLEPKWWALDLHSTLSEQKIDDARRTHYSGS